MTFEGRSLIVESRTEELPQTEDETSPKVGRWYWVTPSVVTPASEGEGEDEEGFAPSKEPERWFGCVVHAGSNYAELRGLGRSGERLRVHFDQFFEVCKRIPNAEAVIASEVEDKKKEVLALMKEVRDVTAKLAVGGGLAIGMGGSETQALALRTGDRPVDEYKTALVHARDETLPELFEKIKEANAEMGHWMSAPLIPLEVQAESLKPAIGAIQERLFSVELYAGLSEEILLVKDGSPAPFTEKIHVMQRRAYMDEECLAEYEAGGMDFKSLKAFDKWLCRSRNLERLMPFPRTLLAFKVRRHVKDREVVDIESYFRVQDARKLDELTFLYIRNGGRVYRLDTSLEFGEELFPDMRREDGTGTLYGRWKGGGYHFIAENEWRAMAEADRLDRERYRRERKAVESLEWIDRPYIRSPSDESRGYSPFDPSNVLYDDMVRSLADDAARHNRLVLVLQGLLDRSSTLHPHPPWSLWRQDSFETAIHLVYDNTRALATGDRPDFEAYRARCNASVKVGSVLLGQELLWEQWEAKRENARIQDRFNRRFHEYVRYRPPGDPGPGKFAHTVRVSGEQATFQWCKKRRARFGEDRGEVGCRFAAPLSKLFHVGAYKPGDFRIFFADPRTRADYLQWAPLLLEAEEFHAGHREVAPVKPMPVKKARTPGGSYEYQLRKKRKALIGQFVRNRYNIVTEGGKKYAKELLWKVVDGRGDDFTIAGVRADGVVETGRASARQVRCVSMSSLIVVTLEREPLK